MTTKQVIVASTNPVKLEAARQGFMRMFPEQNFHFQNIQTESGVSDQPMGRAETLQGALNRAQRAASSFPQADFAVGIEGGVEVVDGHVEVFAWVVVRSGDVIGRAQTGVFILPDEVARLVQSGIELGNADDIVFQRTNSKQESGSIGLLTDDALTRATYYINAVIMALIPFKKPGLTWI